MLNLYTTPERTRVLELLGFQVLRDSNIEIYDNMEGVLQIISDTLENL